MNGNLIKQAELIKSLAHPTRLLIIKELADGEKCVCRLRDAAGADISTVSRHLAILKNTGIVSSRKAGTHIFYSLACRCTAEFFSCIEKMTDHKTGGNHYARKHI
ncbi:MAG: metalloregulator ArsR/SmtB family transcription factor [Elusimicrobiaceae bacterium]|nr:metalloregulator ArsR/SmtB family transcription factor [Elusimicrobiaceae bacterium]